MFFLPSFDFSVLLFFTLFTFLCFFGYCASSGFLSLKRKVFWFFSIGFFCSAIAALIIHFFLFSVNTVNLLLAASGVIFICALCNIFLQMEIGAFFRKGGFIYHFISYFVIRFFGKLSVLLSSWVGIFIFQNRPSPYLIAAPVIPFLFIFLKLLRLGLEIGGFVGPSSNRFDSVLENQTSRIEALDEKVESINENLNEKVGSINEKVEELSHNVEAIGSEILLVNCGGVLTIVVLVLVYIYCNAGWGA